jgi:coenzyme F420-dependent glucose-6-phosphate dehydrogenase
MTLTGGNAAFEVGYWLSSEEHGPHDLVANAVRAEAVGFRSAMISDHFHPWVRAQGQAPFVWAVLGAIANATTNLRVGTGVTAPLIRMHPAVVAHAAATVAVLFEGRFFLGLGTGERLSEHVTGRHWPSATVRRAMLEEAVGVIRALFEGRNVNRRGEFFHVENAELFTLPVTTPDIVLAVSGASSAKLAGALADGMLAVSPSPRAVEAFEAAGGSGKRRIGQLHVCWAPTEDLAQSTVARMWPNGAVKGAALSDLARPRDFEAITKDMSEDQLAAEVVCGPDPARHVEAVGRFAAAGFTEVFVHQIGRDQEGFFRFYTESVLPRFPG